MSLLYTSFPRDQYQLACQYTRHFFALSVLISHRVRKKGMNFEEMQMYKKYIVEHILAQNPFVTTSKLKNITLFDTHSGHINLASLHETLDRYKISVM